LAAPTAEEKRTVRKNIIGVAEKKLVARKILGINVLDHVIIGDGRYVSLKEEGYIN